MIGVDEVGRGCWAGPLLVVAARANSTLPAGLADSKVLTKKKRETLHVLLQESCDFGEGWVEPTEIDRLGLADAMRLAVKRALNSLNATADDEIIMDGTINYCAADFTRVQCIAKADATYPIVSAASIYAKVTRDQKMAELATQHPQYGFEKHVGYGTKEHLAALHQYGITPLHRLSYKPLKQFI